MKLTSASQYQVLEGLGNVLIEPIFGVDLYKVKELLGHKTINMTMRYAHHYPESLRSSVEVLDTCYAKSRFGDVSIGTV